MGPNPFDHVDVNITPVGFKRPTIEDKRASAWESLLAPMYERLARDIVKPHYMPTYPELKNARLIPSEYNVTYSGSKRRAFKVIKQDVHPPSIIGCPHCKRYLVNDHDFGDEDVCR